MTFKELKEGDKLYIVNEGKDFGIRIEEHEIKKITSEYGDTVLKLDDTTSAYIDEILANTDKCGFYFINREDAEEYFLKKFNDVYYTLIARAAEYFKKYNRCVDIMNNISLIKDEIETDRILR